MKLYKEVSNVLSICQEVTDDILAQLPYLKACVKEAQRLTLNIFLTLKHELYITQISNKNILVI